MRRRFTLRHVETHLFPLAVAVNLLVIAQFSNFGIELFIVSETVSHVACVVYAGILAWLAVGRLPLPVGVHRVGTVLAVLVYGGRAFGLADAWGSARWAVTAPITETVVLLIAVLIWHRRMMVLDVKRRVCGDRA